MQPTIDVNLACFETEDEAWSIILAAVTQAQISNNNHYQFSDSSIFKAAQGYGYYENFEKTFKRKTTEEIGEFNARPQAWGTPEQVLQKLIDIREKTSAEEIVLNARYGGMSAEHAERSLRLFAQEVLPKLQELDAPLSPEVAGLA